MVTILWGGIAFNLWRDYRAAERDAAGDSTNLARAYAENIARTIEAIDQTLLFVRRAYPHDRQALDIADWAPTHSILNVLRVQVAIADRDGIAQWSSLGRMPPDVDISDREHFLVQKRAKDDALYISTPVVGRVSKRRTIQFVRRMETATGAFDGIAVISVDPASLSQFYESLDLGRGSITLMNADGVVLARAPDPDGAIGTHLPDPLQTRLLRNGSSGTFRTRSVIDGEERIYSVRKLDDYPLAVSVGIATRDAFASYEWNRSRYLAGGIFLSLASIAAGGIMQRQRRSLLNSRQALAATLENMSQGIMMVDPDGAIAVVNHHATQLLGLPPQRGDLPPPYRELVDRQHASSDAEATGVNDGASRGPRGPEWPAGENRVFEDTRPNGTVLEVRMRGLADCRTVITFTDVTERKRSEEALAAAQTRAAHAERMQALGQLAGGIAHDFNNVLQIVQGSARLIEKRSVGTAGIQQFTRMIVDAAERGASITRRLLSFARRGELRAEPIEPASLLQELGDVLRHTLGSQIEIKVVVDPGVPAVLADKGQLETVLVNLSTNARDAMHDGGVLHLAVESERVVEGAIHPADLLPGRYVHFSIGDTGVGMDEATLARVVEPFFTTKDPGRGTGLGLPMAKGFVEQSGGSLLIDSSPGGGTTVHLWLPASDGPRQSAALVPTTSGPAVAGSGRRVLLVDDEALVRESLTWMLEDAGFTVVAAEGGAEALAILEREEVVDVLVTDLTMPGIGGLSLIRQAQHLRPGLSAVLLTGYTGTGAQFAIGESLSGAFSLLRKPVTAGQLIDRIEAMLAVVPTT